MDVSGQVADQARTPQKLSRTPKAIMKKASNDMVFSWLCASRVAGVGWCYVGT